MNTLCRMNIIILGAGLVGWQLARQLVYEGKEVTLIERDPDLAQRAAERLDCRVVVGEGNNLSLLRSAGIKQADYFISVTESDEINMIACGLVAAEYPNLVTVARVRNLGYSTARMVRQRMYGIDHIINPEIEAAKAVVRSLEKGAVGTVNQFSESGLSMTSVSVEPGSNLIDRTVKDTHASIGMDYLLPLILRSSQSIVPSGETVIHSGDILYIIADSANTDTFLRAAGLHPRQLKRIAIAGGSLIGRYVADYLLGNEERVEPRGGLFPRLFGRIKSKVRNRSVHFIERDYAVARELAELYPAALVTNADISDEEVNETGLLDKCDLLISATGSQELNLVSSLYAKNHRVNRTIALVRKASYVTMAREMGVDVTVSITETMVDSILSILRRGNVRSVHSIAGSDFEVVDFHLDAASSMHGKILRNLKLPRNTLILLVHRENDTIIPKGDLELAMHDRLVVITPRESARNFEEVVANL